MNESSLTFLAIVLSLTLAVSAPAAAAKFETDRYAELMNMRGSKDIQLTKEMEELRPRALRETAERIGVQEAFKQRYGEFRNYFKAKENNLDRMYDFTPFLLHKGHVVPPVITSADRYADLPDPNRMIMVGSSYKILKPARFVSVAPSWRDYLMQPEGALRVEDIHPAMLPRTNEEISIWHEGIDTGWHAGIEHAERLFERSLNELKRDYAGLIQYKILSLKGYISTPMISEGHYAVRVGDDTLEFDQQIFRITKPAKFIQRDEWKTRP